MEFCDKNVLAMNELKRLIYDNYKEPVDGNLHDATRPILDQLKSSSDDEFRDTDSESSGTDVPLVIITSNENSCLTKTSVIRYPTKSTETSC